MTFEQKSCQLKFYGNLSNLEEKTAFAMILKICQAGSIGSFLRIFFWGNRHCRRFWSLVGTDYSISNLITEASKSKFIGFPKICRWKSMKNFSECNLRCVAQITYLVRYNIFRSGPGFRNEIVWKIPLQTNFNRFLWAGFQETDKFWLLSL